MNIHGPGFRTGVVPPNTIKCHILNPVSVTTGNAWVNFSGFSQVTGESYGKYLELNADTIAIDVIQRGFYLFGGCVHYKDSTGSGFVDLLLLTRLYKNNNDEARCSQRGLLQTIREGGQGIVPYSGTDYLNKGDKVRLQYYTNKTGLEFFSNANFDNPVAASIWLVYQGDF